MPAIDSATITAFFLFDVADEFDLAALQNEIGGGAAKARFVPKSGAPSYFKYAVPPLLVAPTAETVIVSPVSGANVSLASTSMELFVLSSSTVAVSSSAVGSLLTSATVTVTVAVALPPLPSLIVYVNVYAPENAVAGV